MAAPIPEEPVTSEAGRTGTTETGLEKELRYPNQNSTFLALPGDILLEILVVLGSEDVHSLLATSTTCRQMHALLYDDHSVWRCLTLAKYDDPAAACAYPGPQEIDWQQRVLSREIASVILLYSREKLGDASKRQIDLLDALISNTLLGLYLDMPAYPAKSRNLELLTTFLKREEFGYLAVNRSRPRCPMMDTLRLALDGNLWDADAVLHAGGPAFHWWGVPDPNDPCTAEGGVRFDAVQLATWNMLHLCLEAPELDGEIVERSLAACLDGRGLGRGEDWAGVAGDWYVVSQWLDNLDPQDMGGPFDTRTMGTWSVAPCSRTDTVEGFTEFMGRPPSGSEAAALDPRVPFSDARPPIYFSGRSTSKLPHSYDDPIDVYLRGVVRLSTDNPPVAVWTWVLDQANKDDLQVVSHVVQMPGRGNAFLGRWLIEPPAGTPAERRNEELIQGGIWMMRV